MPKQGKKYNQENTIKRMDIFYADLSVGSAKIGSEQVGTRPVLIIQNDIGNQHSPTVIVSSITAQKTKSHLPTHISLPAGKYGLKKDSVVLLEQIRTIDKTRLIQKISQLDGPIVNQINEALAISIGLHQK